MPKHVQNVSLLNRNFPVTVPAGDEACLAQAVQLIEAKLQAYKSQYNVRDELALALMCCIEFASDYVKETERGETLRETVGGTLQTAEGSLQRAQALAAAAA